MKILFLTNQLAIGGIEKNIVRLTKELHARGHDVWTASSGGSLVPELIQSGGRHVDIDFSPRRLPRSILALTRLMRHEAPDVVHVFSASSAITWRLSRIALRATNGGVGIPPAVCSVMGLQNSPDERSWRTHARVLVTTLGSQRVIIMAPAIDDVVVRLPISPDRLIRMSVVGVVVPSDLNHLPQLRDEVRKELGISPDGQVVMTIGNLEPRKSHELFVRAAGRVAATNPTAQFFIAGEGYLRPKIKEEILATPDPHRVRMLGARHDIERLLAACDVYVRPGIVEGFIGITVMEAQALARPVVAFDLADVRLAIENGVTGTLVPLGDYVALATAIQDLLEDRALARRLGQAGRRHVGTHYSMTAIVDALLKLYGDLLKVGAM